MPRRVNAAKRLENLDKLEATGAVDVLVSVVPDCVLDLPLFNPDAPTKSSLLSIRDFRNHLEAHPDCQRRVLRSRLPSGQGHRL